MTCARPQLFPRDASVRAVGGQPSMAGWRMTHAWLPLAEQSTGWLPAPAALGTEDPKRVERHGQSPSKHHPNRPERSTATERPDTNQEQVDHHVGEEDTIERLPGRT